MVYDCSYTATRTWCMNTLQVQEAVQQAVIDPAGRQNTIRAWQSSLLRDVPMGAIQIAIFELLKTFLIQSPDITFDTNSLQAEVHRPAAWDETKYTQG